MSFFDVERTWRWLHVLEERIRYRWTIAVCALAISIPAFSNTIQVTNTNTSGAGSLDQAIQDFISGGTSSTITFDVSLIGSTISITQAYSFSANSLTLDGDVNGDGASDITLQSDAADHGFFFSFRNSSDYIRKLTGRKFQYHQRWRSSPNFYWYCHN